MEESLAIYTMENSLTAKRMGMANSFLMTLLLNSSLVSHYLSPMNTMANGLKTRCTAVAVFYYLLKNQKYSGLSKENGRKDSLNLI